MFKTSCCLQNKSSVLAWPGDPGRSRVLCNHRQPRQTDCLIPVQNLVGVKQSVCLGWLCLHDALDLLCWTGQNGTFVLMSPVGFEQVELSPCKCSTRRFQTNQTFKITSQSSQVFKKICKFPPLPVLCPSDDFTPVHYRRRRRRSNFGAQGAKNRLGPLSLFLLTRLPDGKI